MAELGGWQTWPGRLQKPALGPYHVAMVSRAYLARKLPQAFPTKDGGKLRTVAEARYCPNSDRSVLI